MNPTARCDLAPTRCFDPDADAATEQAWQIVTQGTVTSVDGMSSHRSAKTICVHGDTPGSAEIAAAVTRKLRSAGVELKGMN